MAPRAWLGNYKVFGSPRVNGQYTYEGVIIQAMEDAASDGMDIAVFRSEGLPFGDRSSGNDVQQQDNPNAIGAPTQSKTPPGAA